MKKMTRIISILLTLAMCFTLLSGLTALADEGKAKVKVVLPVATEEENFFREQHEIFMQENPDIEVELLPMPISSDEYGNAIQLMFASNEGPDIFRCSGTYPTKMSVSVAKGWMQPLTEYITDDFKAEFPETFFGKNSGLFVGDDIYALPLMDVQFNAFRPFFYNEDILKEYGFDAPPTTWEEMESMAKTITEEGKGRVFGFSICGEAVAATVTSLAECAGYNIADAHTTEGIFLYDMETGKSAANNPSYDKALNYVKGMYDDNIFPPGWETWKVTNLIQQFAAGKIGMMIINGYVAKEIASLNPDINLKVAMVPVPEEGRAGYRYMYYAAEPYFGMGSGCEYPEATFKLLQFYSTPEFQEAFYIATGRPTYLWSEYNPDNVEAYTLSIMENASKSLKIAPYPALMHEDGEELLGDIMSNMPKPTIKEIYNMAIIGEESYESLASKYDEQTEEVIDKYITELNDAGSTITRDVLKMPADWDHMTDYIME